MSFYFYDLETSGFDARRARIMQFAGQRVDKDFKPIGKPDDIYVKLTEDILPEPDAVLVHGITPQKTLKDGLSEAEFLKYLGYQVFIPDTITVGFNNIRFDDEFMRFSLWRNFTDAYEWQWKDGRGRWDLLDVARMTRALRPEGIKWPHDSEGKATNRLELLSRANKLDHTDAHNALSDVKATIALTRLIRDKQPKLFDYLLKLRDKTKVAALVNKGDPFLYTSGRYSSEYQKTTIAVMVTAHPDRGAALVYDLRADPSEYIQLDPLQLAEAWKIRDPEIVQFPVKVLSYNRCPAVAPLSVMDAATATRLKINSKEIDDNLHKLVKSKDFGDKLIRALELLQPKTQPELLVNEQKVDELLYEGFVNDSGKTKMRVVRAADADKLSDLHLDFADERLKVLLPLYKARNFPDSLNTEEQKWWQNFRAKRLLDGGENSPSARYLRRLDELGRQPKLSKQTKRLLEELRLYAQTVVPRV